jgi:hypothetical protein
VYTRKYENKLMHRGAMSQSVSNRDLYCAADAATTHAASRLESQPGLLADFLGGLTAVQPAMLMVKWQLETDQC